MTASETGMAGARVAVIGGGPAGLMAAETLGAAGVTVSVYERMPTVGRKFMLAGKSGLNITHAEAFETFISRYGASCDRLAGAVAAFPPDAVRAWMEGLGHAGFVGTSGRVFPVEMKASPLLRDWLRRIADQGTAIHLRHRFTGFEASRPVVEGPDGRTAVEADAVLLAFGGASWPRLGSDAGWVEALAGEGIRIAPFRPANCGFDVGWSAVMAERHAGEPVKAVAATSDAGRIRGEFVVTAHGIEGSLVYAHAAALRDRLERDGSAELLLDLVPDRTGERLAADLSRQGSKASLSSRLRKGAGLDGVKAALVRELAAADDRSDPARLAAALKALRLPVLRSRPIAEAISSAGGIAWDEIDESFMLRKRPGLFVAGEMIDWEAPTGGYLLTGCLATGRAAAHGILTYLNSR